MLTVKKSFKKKILRKLSWRSVSLHFLPQDFPPKNDDFFTYYRNSTKIQKSRSYEKTTLGRKNRTCHVTAPLALTWHTQLFVTVTCVWRGRENALDMATISPNLNVSFNLSKN
jgi:hypothetical protein